MPFKMFIVLTLVFQVIYCDWSQETKEIKYTHTKGPNIEGTFEIYFESGLKIDKVFLDITTLKKFGTAYRPIMIKFTENFCDLVGNKSNSFIAQQLRKVIATSITNILEPCPLMGKKYLSGKKKNAIYSESFFPPLIPIGDWKISIELTTYMNRDKEFMLEFVDAFEVTQKTATQF